MAKISEINPDFLFFPGFLQELFSKFIQESMPEFFQKFLPEVLHWFPQKHLQCFFILRKFLHKFPEILLEFLRGFLAGFCPLIIFRIFTTFPPEIDALLAYFCRDSSWSFFGNISLILSRFRDPH